MNGETAETITGQEIAVLPKGSPELLESRRIFDPEVIERRRVLYMSMLDQILELGDTAIPAGYDKDYDKRRLQVISAINYGAECGLAPYNALRCVYFVNARPSLHSDGPGAVAEASGQLEENWVQVLVYGQIKALAEGGPVLAMFPEKLRAPLQFWAIGMMSRATDDRNYLCAVAVAWRRGRAIPMIGWFDTIWANEAGLFDKKGGITWKLYTPRMLKARAQIYALRDAVPEAFQGMYLDDEIRDIERERGEGGKAANEEAVLRVVDAVSKPVQEDEKVFREQAKARTRALLAQKFPAHLRAPAMALARAELGHADTETMTAAQWRGVYDFLNELSPKDRRLLPPETQGDPPAA